MGMDQLQSLILLLTMLVKKYHLLMGIMEILVCVITLDLVNLMVMKVNLSSLIMFQQ